MTGTDTVYVAARALTKGHIWRIGNMNVTFGLSVAAAALTLTVIWLTIPKQQIWFRRLTLLLWAFSTTFSVLGYGWPSLWALLLCMLLTMTAWHHRSEWQIKARCTQNSVQE